MNSNSVLSRLQRAEGSFPCDPSTRAWRLFFILVGWIIFPAGAAWIIFVGDSREYTEMLSAVTLLIGGLVWGYMGWLQKDHRYEIRDGVISSVGRRVLWSLHLDEVHGIKEYRSGSFSILWLHAKSRTRGLVLYRSLQHLLECSK